MDVLAHCWVIVTPGGYPYAVRNNAEAAEEYVRNLGAEWRVIEYVRADADRGAVEENRKLWARDHARGHRPTPDCHVCVRFVRLVGDALGVVRER
jgi:hypothetical protein